MPINLLASSASTVLNALSALLTVPYLVHTLGLSTYGVWTLVSGSAAYFLVLDFGLTVSVGRLVAERHSKGDMPGLNTVASTAVALFGVVALLVGLATWIATAVFVTIFKIDPRLAADVTLALAVVGGGIAVYFATGVFQCVLWSYERFAQSSLVDIPVTLGRTAATFLLIGAHSSLTDLALVTLGANVAQVCLWGALCWRVEPRLRLSPGLVSRPAAVEIVALAGRFSLLNTAKGLGAQIGPLVIGLSLASRDVGTFAITRQLITYANTFMVSVSNVATARATILFFSDDLARQRALFVEGGKFGAAVAMLCLGGFTLYGPSFLHLWQPNSPADAAFFLLVLVAGETLPMSQIITAGMLVSLGKLRQLSLIAAGEAVVSLAGAALLVGPFGIAGVCAALSLAALIFRGMVPLVYASRLLGVNVAAHVVYRLAPVIAVSAPCLAVFHLVALRWPPTNWSMLVLQASGYVVLSAVAAGSWIVGYARVWALLSSLMVRLRAV